MQLKEVLPKHIRKHVEFGTDLSTVNPSLRLDRYARVAEKAEQQHDELRNLQLAKHPADAQVLREALARRQKALGSGATWRRKTSDSLALHLSRATVLENASICLHPIYGFPVVPGTGLKGLARAWAETVWAPQQEDKRGAWKRIQDVFGVGEETDQEKDWMPTEADRYRKEDERAGGVVFYDAWPVAPPQLQIDFSTPHHKEYYEDGKPPGDWDNPEPAAFLSVPSGTEFEFAVTPTGRGEDGPALAEQAREWLNDALTVLGAGAKTNAGYGRFEPLSGRTPELPKERFLTATHRLTLSTPAFFAGDQTDPRSCRLRGGTLRGLLRWWWRTMHAGFLTTTELSQLEREIWGGISDSRNEGQSSAISIRLRVITDKEPVKYVREQLRDTYRLPWPDRREKATPGLTFLSYGMGADGKDPRYYLPAGASWEATFVSRATAHFTAEEVRLEAENALWLLTTFGGSGAKGRKSFGCLRLDEGEQLESLWKSRYRKVIEDAKQARAKVGVTRERLVEEPVPGSLSARVAQTPAEMRLGAIDEGEQGMWAAIHRLGTAIRMFCSQNKRNPEKKALGMPRRVDRGPVADRFKWEARHSSPIHYYVFRRDGSYWVRVLAFPSGQLPNIEFSQKYLTGFIQSLRANLQSLESQQMVTGAAMKARVGGSAAPAVRPPAPNSTLRAGAEVVGILIDEKTKKGKWRAEVRGQKGSMQNDVHADAKPGDAVRLRVKVPTGDIAFEYLGRAE